MICADRLWDQFQCHISSQMRERMKISICDVCFSLSYVDERGDVSNLWPGSNCYVVTAGSWVVLIANHSALTAPLISPVSTAIPSSAPTHPTIITYRLRSGRNKNCFPQPFPLRDSSGIATLIPRLWLSPR